MIGFIARIASEAMRCS